MQTYLDLMASKTLSACKAALSQMTFVHVIEIRKSPTVLTPTTVNQGAPFFYPFSVPLYPFMWPDYTLDQRKRVAVVKGDVLDPAKAFYTFRREKNICYLGEIPGADFTDFTRNQWLRVRDELLVDQDANEGAVKELEAVLAEAGVNWQNCDRWE